MTLTTNRGNVRSNLKIDPKKKIWSDDTLDRFINEGQKWMVDDSSMTWGFGETIGYLVPVLAYNEYSKSLNDNPENFFSPFIRQLLNTQVGNRVLDNSFLIDYPTGISNRPSRVSLFAERIFLNAGYDEAAIYTTIHDMDTFNGNGTWVAINDALNVSTDAVNFKQGSGSVSFDIDVSATMSNKATIFNSDFAPVDLSSFQLDEGGIIFWAYLEDNSKIRAFEVSFGNDSNNYYSIKQYDSSVQGQNYDQGWNRIFIPSLNRAKIGSPDLSVIDYFVVNIEFDSDALDQTGVKIDNIQYVDKYISYLYTQKAKKLTSDGDQSIVPEDLQFIYELYATSKALGIIPGKEASAQKFFDEATFQKNRVFEEDAYNTIQEFKMI